MLQQEIDWLYNIIGEYSIYSVKHPEMYSELLKAYIEVKNYAEIAQAEYNNSSIFSKLLFRLGLRGFKIHNKYPEMNALEYKRTLQITIG